jgi:hypothetical protein
VAGIRPFTGTWSGKWNCAVSDNGVAPALNHVVDATFKAEKQPTLTATGAYLSDDGVHPVIGTCKYSYERVGSAAPGLFGCVP